MSFDLNKLQKVVDLGNGVKRARCPACAETGQDKTGEHLKIGADGKFGCCVHAGDKEHRKRIFALAGQRDKPRGITVKVATAKVQTVQSGIFGRLGRVFATASTVPENSDASDGVAQEEIEFTEVRTAETESTRETVDDSRTLRTGLLNSRVYVEENPIDMYKEFGPPVRSVRNSEQSLPVLLSDGTLSIPFDSPDRYHWWKGGQSIASTCREIFERKEQDASPF